MLIISIGELGTHVLEAVSRSGLFRRIVVASRSGLKAQQRLNNALIGAGLDGYFPRFEAVELDFNDPACVKQLRALAPDVIFSAPSLRPWWRTGDPATGALPFAALMSLHLAPMAVLRERMAEADLDGIWIAASFPDVINPCLSRSGYGPHCGVGNVQEPIAKIQAGVGRALCIDPREVAIRLVAQHAFEYYVMREEPSDALPPYQLQVLAAGEDVSDLGHQILHEPFPFPYDLHFNRVTASACLVALRTLAATGPSRTHLPGVLGLPGGYPVLVEGKRLQLDLAEGWSVEAAVATNTASLPWDGIDALDTDGTVHFTQETSRALHDLTGHAIESLHPSEAARQARWILDALPADP
ncbi:MAG: hypothetical protein O2985_02705 [Proteobacteria bacterium]|nr:hypothetical protein [Pseudomonadota bacterium]